MARRQYCHDLSPGRRFVHWLHRQILRVLLRNLLTPSETVLLGLGFTIFVVLFITILLPIYLGEDVSGAGYAGSIIPICYLVFTGHYVFVRCYHRMASSSQFDSAMFHFEKWSRQADSAWFKIGIAFREAKTRERMLGEAVTQADVSDKIATILKTDEVTDLAAKLRRAVDDMPQTYYETKLLKLLFPETREQRKQRNRRKIIFLPILRMWVWRKSVVALVLFFVCFLIPLVVFLPISYKNGTAPSSATPASGRRLQNTTPQMYYATYYAIYFFSLFLPFVYLIFLVLDAFWVAVHSLASCFSRWRSRGTKGQSHAENEPHTNLAGALSASTKANRLKKAARDPMKKNLDLAESDLNDAFDAIRERSNFTWSQAVKRMTTVNISQRGLNEDRTALLDVTFRAFENFQENNVNPDVRVIRIRAAALAGRVFCLRRDLILEWKQRNDEMSNDDDNVPLDSEEENILSGEGESSGSKGLLTSTLRNVTPHLDPNMTELQILESALTRAMSTYTEVAKMSTVQRALLLIRVMKRLREKPLLSPSASFTVSSGGALDIRMVVEDLKKVESSLLGLDKKDPAKNEIQWMQELRDIEERLEGCLIELQSSRDEDRTKEAQFLCWIGLAWIRAATRGLEEGEIVANHLKRSMQEEIERKNLVARRLSENVHVRKCFFWIAYSRLIRNIARARKKMELQAAKRHESQPTDAKLDDIIDESAAFNATAVPASPSAFRKQLEQLRKAFEAEILELAFGQPDPTLAMKTRAQLSDFLKQGLTLPVVTTSSNNEEDEHAPELAATSRGNRAGTNIPATIVTNRGGRDDNLLTQQEVFHIETALAQAYAAETLACLLGLEFLGPKRRGEMMDTIKEMVKRMERFFSPQVLKQESVRYVMGLAKLEDQLSSVEIEWHELTKKEKTQQKFSTAAIQHRENCFRKGVSFEPEVPIITAAAQIQLDELRSKSYAGLVLMNVILGKLEEAEGWTDRLRLKLPAWCLDSACVELALEQYRKARLESQLGSIMYRVYSVFTLWNGRLMLHLLVFWALFVLPLALGLNFVLNHPSIPENALKYDWFADSVFWLQFFGVLLPVFFLLASSLRWTLAKRLLWFGEKEAAEELYQDVTNTLIAVHIARGLERKRRQQAEESLTAEGAKASVETMGNNPGPTLAPRFGGEYPYWAMGEHLITAPGKKAVHRQGYRLQVTRMALVLFFFGLCPLVALPPTMVILTTNKSLPRSSAYYYVLLVITIAFPLITMLFFTYKLLVDALPATARHARNYALWYLIIFVAFPLALAIPLLVADTFESPVATASLFTWLISSLLGCAMAFARDFIRCRDELNAWVARLTWERHPIEKIGRFGFFLAVVFIFAAPTAVFGILLADIFAPTALSVSAQSSVSFTVAALEVTACLACVIACTSGVKLGWIHPTMAASSILPFCFVTLGGMIATTMAVKIVRRNGDPSNVIVNSVVMQPIAEGAIWGVAAQFVTLFIYLALFKREWEKREMFGYFPDDWELVAPTARFVVEEARDVPFESDRTLRRELVEHGLEIPLKASSGSSAPVMDRAKAEQVLEETIRRQKQDGELFELKVKKRRSVYEKQVKHQLAETVFAEIMRSVGDDVSPYQMDAAAQGAAGKILRRYRVAKKSVSLNYLLGSALGQRFNILQMVRFRPTHLLDLLESEFHVVNILFKVIHAYQFDSVQEFRWVTPDNVVSHFPQFHHPEVLVSLLEIRFQFKLLTDRTRLLVFETADERDEFIRFVWKRTMEKSPDKWTYDGEGVVDSLRQIGSTTAKDSGLTLVDSANV